MPKDEMRNKNEECFGFKCGNCKHWMSSDAVQGSGYCMRWQGSPVSRRKDYYSDCNEFVDIDV